MPNNLGYELGKTYFNSYWLQRHIIIAEHENGAITSQWEDGSKTTHATSRRDMDWLIIDECEPCQVRNAFKCKSCKNHVY